jgi:hypothetical protein
VAAIQKEAIMRIARTNKEATFAFMDIWRREAGNLWEGRAVIVIVGLMGQLGMLPLR